MSKQKIYVKARRRPCLNNAAFIPFFVPLRGMRVTVLLTLMLLMLSAPVLAADPTPAPEQDLVRLQEHYRQLTSLTFDFTQLTRTQVRVRKGKGTAIFVRINRDNNPGIMRWNYEEPEQQIILNTGRELSIYNAKDHQLLIMPASAINDDITYSLFSGTRKLEELFTIQPVDPRFVFRQPGTELQSLRLVPRKPHPQVRALQLWFDDQLLIHHLVIEDHFDTITEMTFTNIKINTIDPDDTRQLNEIIRLDLPEGVEILRQ